MAKRKRLDGYEYDQADDYEYMQEQNGLVKRKGGFLKKFLIGLLVTVLILVVLIVGGLFVGNSFFENATGVSLWTAFDVVTDFGEDGSDVVTNSFDAEEDTAGFYASFNSNLYLKEETNTQEQIGDYMTSLISASASGSEMPDATSLIGLFARDNIDGTRLSSYDGWKSSEQHISSLVSYSDRQFAGFLSDIVLSALDTSLASSTDLSFDLVVSDALALEQVIICTGSEFSQAEYARLDANSSDEYFEIAFSLDLMNLIEQMLGDTIDVSSFEWVLDWLLPEKMYLSSVISITDTTAPAVIEINYLDHTEVEYNNETMTKQDRAFMVIEQIVNGFGGELDIEGTIDTIMANVSSFIVRDAEASFSFGNLIVEDSISGGEFKIDLLGSLMDMIGESISLASEDFIVLLQTIISPDVDALLESSVGASVYESTQSDEDTTTITQSSYVMASATTDTSEYGDYDLDDLSGTSDMSSLIDQYGESFLLELAESYGVETTYTTTDDDGEEVENTYTVEDMYGALGLGEETEVSAQLKEEITVKADEIQTQYEEDPDSFEPPSITITDEILCLLVNSQMATLDTTIEQYGATFQKLGIITEMVSDVEHTLVDLYFTIDLNGLLGETEIGDLLSGILGESKILLKLEVDVTMDILDEEKLESSIYINGLEGADSYLNGLASEYVFEIIGSLTDFDVTAVSESVGDVVSSAFDSISTSSLVGINFQASEVVTDSVV